MNIGFDAKRYFHNRTGLGNYSRDLVDTVCQKYPDNKYFLFDKNPTTLDLPSNTIAVVPIGGKILWRAMGMLKDVKRFNLDVFHGLSNELAWGAWPKSVKKVVTIHDVIFKLFPAHYNSIDRYIYEKKTSHALQVADVVVATSRATAHDIRKFYQVDGKRLEVVYQTCGNQHWTDYSPQQVMDFRNRRNLSQPFILYVSSFQKRKNHMALLKALKMDGMKQVKVVLAGRKKETYDQCAAFVRENGLDAQVTFITDISNAELPLLYRSAQSFIYPSMMEGFGIPMIEAACANLPMAVSDIPVFKEIAPKGTLFFNMDDTKGMALAMKELIEKGLQDHRSHLQPYMPGFAAEQMMRIYTGENL
jgi:glycosyltransferase involved in cell wall biosynthesis